MKTSVIKAALIVDGMGMALWQKRALDHAADMLDIRLVLSCNNTKNVKRYLKHFLYYLLNLISIKSWLTKRVKFDAGTARVVEFASCYDGSWQKIPDDVVQLIKEDRIDLIIKFGMSLLRVDKEALPVEIFSFHHGDPSEFRGRPAGFYEILYKKNKVGTIVQSITNRLDAGRVWAISHSKIFHHSYKATTINFYAGSKYLLRKALVNYVNKSEVILESNGKNYSLPSNLLVIKFSLVLILRKFSRVLYGLFFEKKWNIVIFPAIRTCSGKIELKIEKGRSPKLHKPYSFYADPFYSFNGEKIRAEAMNSFNGQGEIVEFDSLTLSLDKVILRSGHYSYPHGFKFLESEYLLPEVSAHSSPRLYEEPFLENCKSYPLKGLENNKIVDATMFEKDGTYYLFCGMSDCASDALFLFHSTSPLNTFVPHPLNPIVTDPEASRMGGGIRIEGGKILRFGQNNCFAYGDGITICEVTSISTTEYTERAIGRINLRSKAGPHTVNFFGSECVVDYYENKFSFVAWYKRLLPLIRYSLSNF